MNQHTMTTEADNGDELLLACPVAACGRRVVLRRSGGFLVLDRGDFYATHSGGTIGITVSPGVMG